MSIPRIPQLLFALVLVAPWLNSGCSRNHPAAALTPVQIERVSSSPSGNTLRYSAAVEPIAEVSLAFKSGGYVDSVAQRKEDNGHLRLLEAGDSIAKDEVLATVRQADYDEKVAQAHAQVAQAEAAVEKAAADFARASNLLSSASLTQVQFDSYKAERDGDAAALKNAQAVLAQSIIARQDSTIRAPFDGWVVQRSAEINNLAGPSSPSFIVADTHIVKVVFGVSDLLLQQMTNGMPVTLTTASLPGILEGRVSVIGTTADTRDRLFPVEVLLPNDDYRLKAGLVATLALAPVGENSQVLTVPLSAIVRSTRTPGGFAAFLIEDSAGRTIAKERELEIGETVGNRIVALNGIKPGDRVVSLGAADLKDGDAVAIIP